MNKILGRDSGERIRIFPNSQRPPIIWIPWGQGHSPRLLHAAVNHTCGDLRNRRQEHTHDVYHAVLVTAETGTFLCRGREWPAVPGRLFLIDPGEPHSFQNPEGYAPQYAEVTFDLPGATEPNRGWRRLLETWSGRSLAARSCGEAIPIRSAAKLEALMCKLVTGVETDGYTLQSELARIFHALLGVWGEADEGVSDGVEKARLLLESNLSPRWTLVALARRVGLSANYLSRAFKARYGSAPMIWQRKIRIETAGRLLRTTSYPLEKVAELTGFSDAYHLSRVFRQLTGTTPGRFRKTPA
jgi:AraC family transcriptional regulator, transcriptional activator of pobA